MSYKIMFLVNTLVFSEGSISIALHGTSLKVNGIICDKLSCNCLENVDFENVVL